MSKIPELMGGRALEHDAAFEDGKGISNKAGTAKLTVTSGVWSFTGGFAMGVSGTGIDVTFYGDTATRDLVWDQSENTLRAADNAVIGWGSGAGTTPDISVTWNGTNLVVSQLTADSAVLWGASGAGINHTFYGDTAGRDLSWDQSNDQLLFADNAKLAIGSGAGAAGDITFAWNGTKMLVAQLTANSAIDWGVDGAGIDMVLYGDTAGVNATWDQSADSLLFTDNGKLVLGTGSDLTAYHDGTNTLINSVTGNLVIDNQAATGATLLDLGTDTSATKVAIRNNTGTEIVTVRGDSVSILTGLRNIGTTTTAITGAVALAAADSGAIFTAAQSSAYDIDLPAPAGPGQRYLIQLVSPGAFNVTVTVAAGAATFEGTIVNDVTSVVAATGNTLTFASGTAALGDWIEAISTSTTKYFIRAVSSAAGGITIA
jgi:hypothetical protein